MRTGAFSPLYLSLCVCVFLSLSVSFSLSLSLCLRLSASLCLCLCFPPSSLLSVWEGSETDCATARYKRRAVNGRAPHGTVPSTLGAVCVCQSLWLLQPPCPSCYMQRATCSASTTCTDATHQTVP